MSIRYVNTKEQLADILTNGSVAFSQWTDLSQLITSAKSVRGHFKLLLFVSPRSYQLPSKRDGARSDRQVRLHANFCSGTKMLPCITKWVAIRQHIFQDLLPRISTRGQIQRQIFLDLALRRGAIP